MGSAKDGKPSPMLGKRRRKYPGSAFDILMPREPSSTPLHVGTVQTTSGASGAATISRTDPGAVPGQLKATVEEKQTKKTRKMKASFGFHAPNEQPVYDGLIYRGLYGTTSPFNRIRVWETHPNEQGVVTKLYDCTCNSRKPAVSFQNVRRHVYRHNVSKYECPQCALVFDKHWR